MGPSYKILVIDDEPDINRLIKRHLEKSNHQVDTCISAESALVKLSEGGFQLIICDFRLPAMNGYELFKIAKKRYQDTPFIFISGVRDESMIEYLSGLYNVMAFLIKPIQFSRLDQLIRRVASFSSRPKTEVVEF